MPSSQSGVERNPIYLQVADQIRRRIADGTYPPESQLPTAAELCDEFRCSTTAVRGALAVLRSAGLVASQQGKGTFVRSTRRRRRRVVKHLYGERHSGSPLFAAIRQEGGQPSLSHASSRVSASRAIANRLAIPEGDPVMETSYRFYADDEPIMLSTSYEPLALTAGTAIERPEESPATGVIPRFDLIGIHIDSMQEHVIPRGPAPEEITALQIPQGVPVMAIERTYFAAGTPIETADMVVAGDNYMLTYVVPIPER